MSAGNRKCPVKIGNVRFCVQCCLQTTERTVTCLAWVFDSVAWRNQQSTVLLTRKLREQAWLVLVPVVTQYRVYVAYSRSSRWLWSAMVRYFQYLSRAYVYSYYILVY